MITNKYLFANLLNFSYTFSLGFIVYIFIILFSILFATYSKSNFLKKDYFYPENFDIFNNIIDGNINKICENNICKSWPIVPKDTWYKFFINIILVGTIIRNYSFYKAFDYNLLSVPFFNFMLLTLIFTFIPIIQCLLSIIISVKNIFAYVSSLTDSSMDIYDKILLEESWFKFCLEPFFNILVFLTKCILFILFMFICVFLILINSFFSSMINFFYFIGCILQIGSDTNAFSDAFLNTPTKKINFKNITICFAIIIAVISGYDTFYKNNNKDVFSGIVVSGALALIFTLFNMIF